MLGIPSPCAYEFIEQNGRYGFVMDRLNGETMLQIIQKEPFRAVTIAKQMAKLHYDLHSILPPAGTRLPRQKDVYTKTIADCTGLTSSEKSRLTQLLEELSTGREDRVCHGDFHAMNVICSGNSADIIDWAFSTLGDPCADVAGTYMITKLLATVSGGRSAFECLLFDTFTPFFANIYLKEYLRLSGRTRKEVIRWVPVRAVTYVDLGLPDEVNKKLYKIAKKCKSKIQINRQ